MNFAAVLSILHQTLSYYIWFNFFCLFVFAYNRFGCYVISDWPSVTGIVTSSGVGYTSTFAMKKTSTALPRVIYSYEVNGEKCTNNRISPGLDMNDGQYIRNMIKRFPAGSEVTVYHHPVLASFSFLSKKPLLEPYLWKYVILGNMLMPFLKMIMDSFKH